jgi:hypothetical protein
VSAAALRRAPGWFGCAAVCALAALSAAKAGPIGPWMTEANMRAEFIGKTLDGHYRGGVTWTETYRTEGRLNYREKLRRAEGTWYFRGLVFCTFYDAPYRPQLNGGCWTVIKASANCYEFYPSGLRDLQETDTPPAPIYPWSARGWRTDEPSTCMEKPMV